MLLSHKIEDIRALAKIVREGWDKKKIFCDESAHYSANQNGRQVNAGWEAILRILDDYFPTPGYLSFNNGNYPTPSSVYTLLEEAEAVLAFFPEKPKEFST